MTKRVRFDNGSKLKKNCIPLLKDFAVKPKPTSIKNSQSNVIVEWVHQVMGDIICMHDLKDYTFDEINPCGPILYNTASEICSTYHTTTQSSPGQLVFGRNTLFNILYTPDWGGIEEIIQSLINKSNQAKNKKYGDHKYKVNYQVLIQRYGIYHKLEGPFLGAYKIVQIYRNGTVYIQCGTGTERINICRITPFSANE